jgi:hypothetical protein
MKECFKCLETKELTCFYKHAGMVGGRLNKCSACCVKDSAEHRIKNPHLRAEEHIRNRNKLGFMTMEEYHTKRKKNGIGRKASSLKYSYKRRRTEELSFQNELDVFVFTEATLLSTLREQATGFKWQVDHIVPMFHKQACGLNTANNFQVVPAQWNQKKGNRNMNTYFNIGF